MHTQSKVDELKRNGFANLGRLALGDEEVRELSTLVRNAYQSLPVDHPHRINGGGADGMRALPEQDARIAVILDRIVSDADVRTTLEALLGRSYKIWQIDFRRSLPGDAGLALHQDARGQVNIAVLLSDSDGQGATTFVPGSHLVSQRMKDLNINIPDVMQQPAMRYLCASLSGRAGDVACFFNRTWHGRRSNHSNQINDAVLIGFFPAGAKMGLVPPYAVWSPAFLESVKGTTLGELIDPATRTEPLGEGMYKILARPDDSAGESFAIQLEAGAGGMPSGVKALQAISMAATPLRPMARLLRGRAS